MREIKFRAWDDSISTMIDWETLKKRTPEGRSYYGLDNILSGEGYHYQVEQFTGLLDKNGKEIYEGDVVFSKIHKPSKMEIRFVEGGFCAFWGDADYPIDINHFYDSKGCCIEVIGNIHENSELLHKED